MAVAAAAATVGTAAASAMVGAATASAMEAVASATAAVALASAAATVSVAAASDIALSVTVDRRGFTGFTAEAGRCVGSETCGLLPDRRQAEAADGLVVASCGHFACC